MTLSPLQLRALKALQDSAGKSAFMVGAELYNYSTRARRSTVARKILTNLCKKGLVERRNAPNSNKQIFSLTEVGKTLLSESIERAYPS